MKTKILVPTSNVSEGVEFLLKGAKKRRAIAIAGVREINSEIGVSLKLVSSNR